MAYPEWLLQLLQALLILVLGPLSGSPSRRSRRSPYTNTHLGIAFSLSTWITPCIFRPELNSRAKIAVFTETIDRGFRYLQPSSRISGLLFIAVTILTYQHSDPATAWKWKFYGAAFLVVIQVAWYEVYFIFPINDTIKAMGERLADAGEQELSEAEQKKLMELLAKWEFRHRMRIAIPFFGCVAAVAATLL